MVAGPDNGEVDFSNPRQYIAAVLTELKSRMSRQHEVPAKLRFIAEKSNSLTPLGAVNQWIESFSVIGNHSGFLATRGLERMILRIVRAVLEGKDFIQGSVTIFDVVFSEESSVVEINFGDESRSRLGAVWGENFWSMEVQREWWRLYVRSAISFRL